MKRRMRAGLPIYPPQIQAPENHHPPPQQQRQPNASSSSLSSLLSSSGNQKGSYNPSLSISVHQFKTSRDNGGGLALSLSSSVSAFSSSSIPLTWFNQGFQTELLSMPSLPNNDPSPNMGVSLESCGLVSSSEIEFLPIQSPGCATTLTSSGNSGNCSDYMITTSGEIDNIAPESSWVRTGLLEDLVEESRALILADKLRQNKLVEDVKGKEKCELDNGLVDNANVVDGLLKDAAPAVHGESFYGIDYGNTNSNNNWKDICSANSSNTVTKAEVASLEDMNSMDNDLFSFLDHFTSSIAVPDWDDGSFNLSNMQPLNMNKGNGEMDNQREALSSPVATNPLNCEPCCHHGSSCWNDVLDYKN